MALDLSLNDFISKDGEGGLRLNYSGEIFTPHSWLVWLNQSNESGNDHFLRERYSLNTTYRYLRRSHTGTRTWIGQISSQAMVIHSRSSEWLCVLTRFLAPDDIRCHVFALDGTEWTGSSTSSQSSTELETDIYIPQVPSSAAKMQDILVVQGDISPALAKAVCYGQNPLAYKEIRNNIVFYHPVESRFDQYAGPGLAIETDQKPADYVIGRPHSHYVIGGAYPFIFEAGAQTITAGAPPASQAAVFTHKLSQELTAGAPPVSQASVFTHSIGTEQLLTAGAPPASQAAVFTHAVSQEITAGAPPASQAAVFTHAVAGIQLLTAGAPPASQAAVFTHSIGTEQLITAGAAPASQAAVFSHTIGFASQVINAGAPPASQAAVFTHQLEQRITAGAPASSASSVGVHTLQLGVVAGASAASQAAVFNHSIASELAITAGAPPASSASALGAQTLTQNVVAGAPVASQAAVFTHSIASEQLITAGAPVASQAAVFSHAISTQGSLAAGPPPASQAAVFSHTVAGEQIITAGAPAASQAAVFSHSIASELIIAAGAPPASQASVGSHSLASEQAITVGAPTASQASVGAHSLASEQAITVGAPVASQAAVFNHTISLGIQLITVGAPPATWASVLNHTLVREGQPDLLQVSVVSSRVCDVALVQHRGLTVTTIPLSGMGTKFHTGEFIRITGTFTEDGVPATASGSVNVYIELPGTDQVDVITGVAEGATGVYATTYRTTLPGTYRWRMLSADGMGVEEGTFDVLKTGIIPKKISGTPAPISSAVVLDHTVAIV